jgi:hypothetical protein
MNHGFLNKKESLFKIKDMGKDGVGNLRGLTGVVYEWQLMHNPCIRMQPQTKRGSSRYGRVLLPRAALQVERQPPTGHSTRLQ